MSIHALLPGRGLTGTQGEPRPAPAFAGLAQPDARLGFWLVLALAFALRAAAALLFPGAHHPDETYQAFEQAHRYAFGYGLKPWEFDDGLRSMLLPALLSLVFRLGDALFGTPEASLALSRILLAALSLLPVAAVYGAGLRRSPGHALVGGLVAATWCELVYFSYRPLTEALATDFLLAALALASFRQPEIARRTLVWIGVCLGLALMLRVHFAPAVLVIGLAASGLSLRSRPDAARMVSLCLGAAVPLAAFGLADWIAWGVPFHAPYAAFRINVVEGMAARFGTLPAHWYVVDTITKLGWVAIPVALLARFGARPYALWLIVAAAILVPHSLIAHKEYRFVFVCTPILVLAAAFASVDLLRRWKPFEQGTARRRGLALSGLAACWAFASLAVSADPVQSRYWHLRKAETEAFRVLSADPDLCGLMLDGVSWLQLGGYAALHRPVPIHQWRDGRRPSPSTAFNTVLVRDPSHPLDGYETLRCFDGEDASKLCLLRRPGRCRPDPGLTPLTAMPRLGDPAIYPD